MKDATDIEHFLKTHGYKLYEANKPNGFIVYPITTDAETKFEISYKTKDNSSRIKQITNLKRILSARILNVEIQFDGAGEMVLLVPSNT